MRISFIISYLFDVVEKIDYVIWVYYLARGRGVIKVQCKNNRNFGVRARGIQILASPLSVSASLFSLICIMRIRGLFGDLKEIMFTKEIMPGA